MFDAIKSWFSGREAEQNTWDANTVQMQQPGMNETITQQPVPQGMDVNVRGGGEGEEVCCGVCAGLCCFECCECCCCC